MLWEPFLQRCAFYQGRGLPPTESRAQAGLDVLKRQATRTIIPRFAETFIREVWEMQSRLLNPKPQQIEALSGHARFRAGFDFMLLREKSGDDTTQGMAAWWENYQNLSIDEKEKAISAYNRQRAKSRRKNTATVDAEQDKTNSTQVEPLVKELERPRRNRKSRDAQTRKRSSDHSHSSQFESSTVATDPKAIDMDHPILRRKRVQRDLSHVIFGPTQ